MSTDQTPSPSPVAAVLAELGPLLTHYVAAEKRSEEGKATDSYERTVAALKLARGVAPILPRLLAAIRAVDELAGRWEAEAAPSDGWVSAADMQLRRRVDALRSALAAVDVAEATE